MDFETPQVPESGPLSVLNETEDWTGAAERLSYNGAFHLRKCFKIPIEYLHFNLENGRYHTKYLLLNQANPGVNIDSKDPRWRDEMLKLLNGTWDDTRTGVNTRKDKPYFEELLEDIRVRSQEKPGIVLENGGVMSGNRRLAALITLANEQNEPRFQRFDAFIVPGHMDAADRWRLEMSAQVGQGRLLHGYEPVEKLLKMREGIKVFLAKNPQGGDQAAMKAVATEFGLSASEVQKELDTLRYIEEWLNTRGHRNEWWLANELTEVFTEMPPLIEACSKNDVPPEERGKLKRAVYHLINNGQANYQIIREIRMAVGARRRRVGGKGGVPTALKILTNNAPTSQELREQPSRETRLHAQERAQRFKDEFEARREERTPLAKAQAAESNLESLVELLQQNAAAVNGQVQLKKSLEHTNTLANQALKLL